MTPAVDKEAELLLAKAAEDEAVLSANIPDGPFGSHVQQAVEKLLKAPLCQLAVKYKRTHDLEYLLQLLRDHGETVPKGAVDTAQIESFGVSYRYDALPEIDILDRPAAIDTVRIIREHVAARVRALSGTP
jgi:HEPN domain-containing protein